MATPEIYKGLKPTQDSGGLTPMQLALAQLWMSGQQPFSVNVEFLTEMNRFASSKLLTPLDVDPRTGVYKEPDLIRNITGVSYFVRGDDIYLRRRALDCAQDEFRFEEIWIGKTYDIAAGTYAYYGRMIRSGTISTGGGGFDGGGGNYGVNGDFGFQNILYDSSLENNGFQIDYQDNDINPNDGIEWAGQDVNHNDAPQVA